MRVSSSLLACGLWAAAAHAEFLVLLSELSFGQESGRIAPERSQKVPNFDLHGAPEILSNKIVLTPAAPAPGNQRGAIWAQRLLEQTQWIAEVDLRVSGPERGGGNVNIWLARDGPDAIGTSSVYTAGKFEGLVLTLDTTGSASRSGGTLRGYLNDGTREFKSLTGIDGMAFGRCDFAYRNLGRPSRIKVEQTDSNFQVFVDGNPCFSSEQVVIPSGYRFGITAASADVPDSAELFKLTVLTPKVDSQLREKMDNDRQQQQQQQQQQDHQQDHQQQQQDQQNADTESIPGQDENGDIADVDADTIASEAQFRDLHNRIQGLLHQQTSVMRRMGQLQKVAEKHHAEASGELSEFKASVSAELREIKELVTQMARQDQINQMQRKLEQIERDAKALHSELRKSISRTEQSLQGRLASHHDTLASELRHPGYQRLILVIVGGQVFLVASYFIYKRRKANFPKKYL